MKRNVEVPRQIREAFEAKVRWCVEIARQKSGKDIPVFPLRFSQMGRRAGVCETSLIKGSTIKINSDFFKDPKRYQEQLDVTLPHEVAHAVVDFLYPPIRLNGFALLVALKDRRGRIQRQVAPHGNEWARVMHWFDLPADVRHQMSMDGVTVKAKVARPFTYVCDCGPIHKLTLRLHTQIQEKGRNRTCRACRCRIIFERQWGKPVKAPVAKQTERVVIVPPKPEPPATHKTVTRFVDGMLQNVRTPLTLDN